MGQSNDTKKKPQLRLVRSDLETQKESQEKDVLSHKPDYKSATARQLNSFADELDKQIAALLNM